MGGAAAGAAAGLAQLDGLAAERGLELQSDAPLAPLTTLRVGGAADRLAEARDRHSLIALLNIARQAGVPAFVLGNGSDLVVADRGIRGLVIRNRAREATIVDDLLTADAGSPMAMLVKRCTAEALTGLEFGISIPGTLGGAVWANAGAHGGEMRDVLEWVDGAAGERHGRAPGGRRLRICLSRVALQAQRRGGGGRCRSPAAGRRGDDRGEVATHQAKRQATQPLADQNAGSVFRNPPGDYAGRLIEAAGMKGHRVGTAMVSTLHANFIVTDRGGRAADVRALGEVVRAAVADRFDVQLAYEIEFVGDWESAGDPA